MTRSVWLDDGAMALKKPARDCFEKEAAPLQDKWEAQQHVAREFWLKAGGLGILCPRTPAEYGGDGTMAYDFAVPESQA